jgi:hypothetical protein
MSLSLSNSDVCLHRSSPVTSELMSGVVMRSHEIFEYRTDIGNRAEIKRYLERWNTLSCVSLLNLHLVLLTVVQDPVNSMEPFSGKSKTPDRKLYLTTE